jgi:RNA polymerase sigma-70 factor, ECF subfamily
MDNKDKQIEFLKMLEPINGQLSKYAVALSKNREIAKDIVSEAILITYQNFENIRDKSKFSHYIWKVTKRLYKRHCWKSRLFGDYNSEIAEQIPDRTSFSDKDFDIQILYKNLDKLPAKQKEAIILFEISGFSIEEIKNIQGGTISAVKSRLKRGREKLTKLLTDTIITNDNRTSDLGRLKDSEIKIYYLFPQPNDKLINIKASNEK